MAKKCGEIGGIDLTRPESEYTIFLSLGAPCWPKERRLHEQIHFHDLHHDVEPAGFFRSTGRDG
jgi:hypothetical protein